MNVNFHPEGLLNEKFTRRIVATTMKLSHRNELSISVIRSTMIGVIGKYVTLSPIIHSKPNKSEGLISHVCVIHLIDRSIGRTLTKCQYTRYFNKANMTNGNA